MMSNNREIYKYNQFRNTQQQIGLAVRYLFSCLIDADRIDTANFEHQRVKQYRPNGDHAKWSPLIARLERKLAAMLPTQPGWGHTLTVPMSDGKTLVSLRFALYHAEQRQLDRIIYIIPFTSIIEQNAQVIPDILKPADATEDHGKIVLEHHSSGTPEQQT